MRKVILALLLSGAIWPARAADFATIHLEEGVDRSADQTWSKIGGYCDIQQWLGLKCAITSGDGGVGTVRSLSNSNGNFDEVLVGRTRWSYTYGQPASTIFYHGILAVEPVDATHSKILYDLIYDAAPLGTPEAKAADKARRTATFQAGVDKMKKMAETP